MTILPPAPGGSLRKTFLAKAYFPQHAADRMHSEGDVAAARENFLQHRHANVDFLLRHRYSWMNDYLRDGMNVIEVGAGAGFSALYLKVKPRLTDTMSNPWVDAHIDATRMDLPDNSVDCIIASHTIHHFFSPYQFFEECARVLKPGGLVLIQEINTSLMMRVMLRLMRHEGWSYEINVFDRNSIANDPRDPWSANCAIPEILFGQGKKFEETFPKLEIILNKTNECSIFLLSGGVIAKVWVPELPPWILRMAEKIDRALIALAPNLFALGRSVVLKKRKV
jgi:SAM-dependent methyltransferase